MGSLPPVKGFESNYPRGSVQEDYTRPPNVYFDSLAVAVRMFNSKARIYVGSTLICVGFAAATFFLLWYVAAAIDRRDLAVELDIQNYTLGLLVAQLLAGPIVSVMLIGLTGIAVRQARGYQLRISDVFLPLVRFKRTLLAVLNYSVPISILTVFVAGVTSFYDPTADRTFDPHHLLSPASEVGLVITLLLAILASACVVGPLTLGFAAATFGDMPVTKAYKEASRRLGWKGLLLSFLLILAAALSLIGGLCYVGILMTGPILPIVIALHYTYYFPLEPTPEAT